MIAFTWQRTVDQLVLVTEGVRLLDTAAPGNNLADAKLIVPSGVAAAGSIKSALIAPDGHDVIVATRRPPGMTRAATSPCKTASE